MSGKLSTVALLVFASVGILHAADRSPKQILGGRPAASNTQSGRYYNGQGAFAGRSATSGQTTRLYDGHGRTAGRVESSNGAARAYSGTGPMPDEPPQVATTPGSMIPKELSVAVALRMATALVSMMAEEPIPGVLKPREVRPGITMRRVGLQEARDRRILLSWRKLPL